ncbi:MAG: formyltransferase family protein [Vicinamibacterales bacterium]|nr:formyltransferase family protein [Vicinamibacterales bacterium]
MRLAVIGRTEVLHAAAEHLRAEGHEVVLVATAREAPESAMAVQEFDAYAASIGARFLASARANDLVAALDAAGPIDVGVSLNYPAVIPQAVIDRPRLGILNAHGGDLPRYRGNACQAWAILNGEPRVALCVHRMVGGVVDAGDIVAREYLPIDLRTTITDVVAWMSARTPVLFADAIARLAGNPAFCLERQSEDPADALRCYPRRPEDARIDWRQPVVPIVRLVNASTFPYAGAFCEFEGARVVVRSAAPVVDGERYLAVPGQITRIDDAGIDVAAGDGKVRLTAIEIEGVAVSPRALARSIRQRFS